MTEHRLRWLLLKIRLLQWKIKTASGVDYATGRASEWHYPKPGSRLMSKLSMVTAAKLDKLCYDVADYEDELENLTLPISEAEDLFNRSTYVCYELTERKQLTVLVMHRQFRVPKAQLARMLEAKR